MFIERIDAAEIKDGDIVTFVCWGNLKIVEVKKNNSGNITEIVANLDLDNKVS